MNALMFEKFLARLYVDAEMRARFVADPVLEATLAGLTPDECAALQQIDLLGLELAAASFARKRASTHRRRSRLDFFRRR